MPTRESMHDPYGLIARELWHGNLCGRPALLATFVFLVAHCNAEGVVDMALEAIVARSRLPLNDVREALDALESTRADDGELYLVPLNHHRWQLVGGRGVEWKPGWKPDVRLVAERGASSRGGA